jgi:hypothetical protein
MKAPNTHDLEETYREMSDGELLQLASEVESLTGEARTALDAELLGRSLEPASQAETKAVPVSGQPEESGPRGSRAKRSAAVTVAGVILLVLSAGYISTLSLLYHLGYPPLRFAPARFWIAYGPDSAFALWGIATAVGILRLRWWARVSGLLVCAFWAYDGFRAALTFLFMPPHTGSVMETRVAVALVAAFTLGIGGLGALGAAFLNSESAEREFHPSVWGNSRSAAVTCIGIWLVAAWPLELVLYLVKAHPMFVAFPSVPFDWLALGWKRTAFHYEVALLSLTLGIGLLRMKSWAKVGVVVLCGAALLSALIFPLTAHVPGAEAAHVTVLGARHVPGVEAACARSLWEASGAIAAAWLLLKMDRSQFR